MCYLFVSRQLRNNQAMLYFFPDINWEIHSMIDFECLLNVGSSSQPFFCLFLCFLLLFFHRPCCRNWRTWCCTPSRMRCRSGPEWATPLPTFAWTAGTFARRHGSWRRQSRVPNKIPLFDCFRMILANECCDANGRAIVRCFCLILIHPHHARGYYATILDNVETVLQAFRCKCKLDLDLES